MIAKAKKSKRESKDATKDAKPEEQIMMLACDLGPLNEAADLLKRIERAEAKCGELNVRMEQLRDEFKQVKVAYASATLELRRLCRARKEKLPLFDQPPVASERSDGAKETSKVLDSNPDSTPANATKDAWRELPLVAANINGSVGQLLQEAGHDTLGKVSKLMNDRGIWWNKEVKGIGEAGANEVADRFAEFWQAHPEFCG